MSDRPPAGETSTISLFLSFGLLVVLGIPMVGYLWETLNQILALHFDTSRMLFSIPVFILFLGLLYLVYKAALIHFPED